MTGVSHNAVTCAFGASYVALRFDERKGMQCHYLKKHTTSTKGSGATAKASGRIGTLLAGTIGS